MTDIIVRLQQAAKWSQNQSDPAPDWDTLLLDAANRIHELESSEFFARYKLAKAMHFVESHDVLEGLIADCSTDSEAYDRAVFNLKSAREALRPKEEKDL